MRALIGLTVLLGGLVLGPPPVCPDAPVRLTPEWRDRFVVGLAASRAGDLKDAARTFAEISQAPVPIVEYALYLEADSLAQLGEVAGARAAAARAVDKALDGPLAPAAVLLSAQLAARDADDAAAAALYRRFLDRHPDHPDTTLARYLLGLTLERSGQAAEAARAYRGVWILAPASAYAEAAAGQERALAARGVPVAPLTDRDKLERAERLLAAGLAAQAHAEAGALRVNGVPLDLALRALQLVVEASRRIGRAEDAARAVDRALGLAPPDRRPAWLLERARLQQQRARPLALATIDRILREHPHSPEAAEGLLVKAQLLESVPSMAEAEAAYGRLAADHADEEAAGRALWRLGWLSWFRGAYQEAALRWGRMAGIKGGQAYREGAAYWAGRAHSERGEAQSAERHFAGLLAHVPRGYYGLLASRRATPKSTGPPREALRPAASLPADALDAIRAEPRYVKAEALRAVGLADFADGEMAEVARRAAGDPARLYAVSAAYVQDARYHLALRILRREFVPLARAGDPFLPRAFWEMLYPLGWRAELTGAAGRVALDPFFVAAVVREESSFDPKARSRVGARGLMQLMPETARPMVHSRGLALGDGELLNDPRANLELGTTFLAALLREFGDPRLAVAAYNAGPRRVREWWGGRRGDDVEVWVEQIPFAETRGFVKRVMVSWEEYRRLYGGRP